MTSPSTSSTPRNDEYLLRVIDLVTEFHTENGVVRAVDSISFNLASGETLGLVGESGSGKSVTNLTIMGLLPGTARVPQGSVLYKGRELLGCTEKDLRAIRGREIAMIFQDPMTSLNPFLRVSRQLTEVLEVHLGMSRAEARAASISMLEKVGIPDPANRIDSYPHELSGGMRQRVMIAMALLCNPSILIADEPTTALDVTIQAQILDLMRELIGAMETAMVLVSHDLGVVAGMADRVVVMYAGKMMEEGPTERIFERPSHPYTLGLLRSIPRLDDTPQERLHSIEGLPPDPANLPPGCPFAPRCPFRMDACLEEFPVAREVEPGHRIRCHADVGPDDADAFWTPAEEFQNVETREAP